MFRRSDHSRLSLMLVSLEQLLELVFGCMKGASDGGINVPHSTKRFPGYQRAKVEEETNKRGKATGGKQKIEATYDSKVHRGKIFGNHVTTYMNQIKKEDAAKFDRQFA